MQLMYISESVLIKCGIFFNTAYRSYLCRSVYVPSGPGVRAHKQLCIQTKLSRCIPPGAVVKRDNGKKNVHR